jgi:polysaccharide export outer membrane protein
MRMCLNNTTGEVAVLSESRFRPLSLIFLAALFALGGCATRGGSVAYDPAGFGRPDLETVITDSGPQRVGPLDRIRVSVFNEPELTGEFTVDRAGTIAYPLLGQVDVQGRTSEEIATLLRSRLTQGLVRDPRVQVAVAEAAAQTVTVEGAVNRSGVYPIVGATTLIRAIALASGTNRDANDARVLVFRTIDGRRMAAAFDLRAIRSAEAEDPPIYGNDLVVVPASQGRMLFRDVLSVIPAVGVFTAF